MSVDYTAVIADLEAKRDGLNDLIAALQNVSRLLPGQSAVQFIEAPKAEKVVGRSVGTRRVPRLAKAKPIRRATGETTSTRRPRRDRDTGRDDALVKAVASQQGIGRQGLAVALKIPAGALNGPLSRLVEEGRLSRHGAGRGVKYWPAGTAAKEAL